MVVDMFLIHNLESGLCCWSLDPVSELFLFGYETLGNSPVSFLVPDDFTIHLSKAGYHFFCCSGDSVDDWHNGYGVFDYFSALHDDDTVKLFCYHKNARCQLFTCYPVSSGKLPVIEIM